MKGFLPMLHKPFIKGKFSAGLLCRPYMVYLIPALPSRLSSFLPIQLHPHGLACHFLLSKLVLFFFLGSLFVMMLPVNHLENNSSLIFGFGGFSRLGVVI